MISLLIRYWAMKYDLLYVNAAPPVFGGHLAKSTMMAYYTGFVLHFAGIISQYKFSAVLHRADEPEPLQGRRDLQAVDVLDYDALE
jgi:hypothetical protein